MFPKLSFNGFLEVLPSAFTFANSGDSLMFLRIKYETKIISIETQNGTLHPQSSNASLLIALLVAIITNKETNNPIVAVV